MIHIYTDQNLLTAANRPHVFPLLFDLWYNKAPDPKISKHYQLTTPIEEADILIYPIAINRAITQFGVTTLKRQLQQWKTHQKPIWTYTEGDYGISLNDEQIWQFRFGGFDSLLTANTQIMPAFIPDPCSIQKTRFFELEKAKMPQIGFVGFSSTKLHVWSKALAATYYGNLKRLLGKDPTDFQGFYPAAYKRKQVLTTLEQSPLIETSFIHRDQYRAGAIAPAQRQKTTAQFFENIFQNPYTLCMRGAGNFSVRFYEVLAAGRIPVLIKTDVRLPLPEQINWEAHCVMIDTPATTARELYQFHQAISDTDFRAIQTRNRQLWQTHLTRESYFCTLHNALKSSL